LRRFIGIFYKLSSNIPYGTLKLLYYGLVYPRILYGIELYANNYMINLHDLTILNNRLLRIIQHRLRDTKVIELYANYSTLPIPKLFQYQFLTFAHVLLYDDKKLPSVISNSKVINADIHNHNTRSCMNFHRSPSASYFGCKISINLISKIWNSLPLELT